MMLDKTLLRKLLLVVAATGLVGTAGIFNFSASDHCGLKSDAFEMLTVKNGRFVLYKD